MYTDEGSQAGLISNQLRDPFSAISHFVGGILSVIALVTLLKLSGNDLSALVASTVYGLSLVFLYVSSFLTHGFHCSARLEKRFEQLDHVAVFFLIAGTYTPLCLLILQGDLAWTILGVEWLLAIGGAVLVFTHDYFSRLLRVSIYLAMGWLFVFAFSSIVALIPNMLLAWLLAGAAFYTVGTIFFITERPRLWAGYFGAHDIWHLFVLAGSVSHYMFFSSYLRLIRV